MLSMGSGVIKVFIAQYYIKAKGGLSHIFLTEEVGQFGP